MYLITASPTQVCCPTEAGTPELPGSAGATSATVDTTVNETVVVDEKEDVSKNTSDGWGGWEAVVPPLEEEENEDYIPFEVEAEEGADEGDEGEVGDDEVADAEPAEKEESEEELLARWVYPKPSFPLASFEPNASGMRLGAAKSVVLYDTGGVQAHRISLRNC